MSLFDHASQSAQYISASKLRHFYLRANYFQFFRLDDRCYCVLERLIK